MATYEQLELKGLASGAAFRVSAISKDESFSYDFQVLKQGEQPLCELVQTNSRTGKVAGPITVVLKGTGSVTTPEQNPTQYGDLLFGRDYQPEALTIGYGRVRTGQFLVAHNPSNPSDIGQFLPACSEIMVYEAQKSAT